MTLPQCNGALYYSQYAKGPGADQEAVRAGQHTAEGKGQCEAPMSALERIHRHHEGQRQDAKDRSRVHSNPTFTLHSSSAPDLTTPTVPTLPFSGARPFASCHP